MKFTNKQIECIKKASDHVEILCGGRGYGKTHQLINEMQDKINNLQSKIDKANELLQLLHYKFKDGDSIHNEIEDIQNILKEGK